MKPSQQFIDYALSHLSVLGDTPTKTFFGGVGVYFGQAQFAMMIGNNLYFVTDETTRGQYRAAGMQPFSYTTKKGQVTVHRYYTLPEEVLTDATQLRLWAEKAIRIAHQTAKQKQAHAA